MNTQKYGRTYHFPFSPGTTSDDRFNFDYWNYLSLFKSIVHTEKLDGENNCLNRYGVFARSHAAPTQTKWTTELRQRWSSMKNDLGDIEIFGENLYAIHSIEYKRLEEYFYVFAVRHSDTWLSWEEVNFYANFFDFKTVPVLAIESPPHTEKALEETIVQWAQQISFLDSCDALSGTVCTMEGIVSRNADSFESFDFQNNIFKYVRKNHVKTDEHWTRNWRRAKLIYEQKDMKNGNF